jgi:hypothetical protein
MTETFPPDEQMQPPSRAQAPRSLPWRANMSPERLLLGGVLAGPLFLIVVIVQMAFRTGFDPKQHPISLLSVGAGGWVQITNFIATGVLIICCAVGVRQLLRGSRAGTWGPILLGLTGLAFIWGGAFVSDPSLGFPPGTPGGIPDQQSWHSALHQVGPVVASVAFAVACFVFARRFLGAQRRGWFVYSVVTPIVTFGLTSRATGGDEYDFRFLLAGMAMLLVWLAAVATHLRRAGTVLA